MKGRIGVYVHIPFCIRKCRYCDFLSFPAEEEVQGTYVDCLVKEIREFQHFSGQTPVADTVFFGGGTPSVLPVPYLESIVSALAQEFDFSDNVEITMECNPGTVDLTKLQAYRRMGINRISFGMQTAVDKELYTLGRIHTFGDAIHSYQLARRAGFENINVDLMSAIPGQTKKSYQFTLEQVLGMRPEHISAYSLIVEKGTPFYEQYGSTPPIDEETDREMYAMTKEMLREHGYARYEISNYAREGFACRHNLKYWSGADYIGFGLGASSKMGNVRYKNEHRYAQYIREIEMGQCVQRVEETLDTEDEMSEFFVLGLRRINGVSRREFSERFSRDAMDVFGGPIRISAEEELLDVSGDRIYFTERGLDLSNYVLCRFM